MATLVRRRLTRSPTFSNMKVSVEAPVVVNKPKTYLLPMNYDNKPTVVLDMDETLIHTHPHGINVAKDNIKITVNGDDYLVSLRPYVRSFLKELSNKYEVVLFTAGTEMYAKQIIAELEKDGKIFSHKLYNTSCKEKFGGYYKNVSKLGRDLKKVICVDDNRFVWTSTDNLIECKKYIGGDDDNDLKRVLMNIEDAFKVDDVRTKLSGSFKRASF
ncbi:Mitochondrial import inner membrane translocase subunit TIM50 [Entamoeba marina]